MLLVLRVCGACFLLLERWKKDKTKIFDLLFEIVPNQFVFTRALLILPPSTTAISLCTCQVELVVVGLQRLDYRQTPRWLVWTMIISNTVSTVLCMGGSVARSHPENYIIRSQPRIKQLSALEHLNNASHISHIIKFTLHIPASHQIQSQFDVYFYKWYRNPNILFILYTIKNLYTNHFLIVIPFAFWYFVFIFGI